MKYAVSTLAFLFMFMTAQAQEFGLASYYNDAYHGKQTAYGETYDKNKMTCAHKRHPLGTVLLVTRMDNKQSVEVRVNDKGPFLPGRIVELSRAAAEKIGLIDDGIAQVRVEVVDGKAEPATAKSETSPAKPAEPKTEAQPQRVNTSPRATINNQDVTPFGMYKISTMGRDETGYGVQVASMRDNANMLRTIWRLESQHFDNVLLSVEPGEGGPLYKVILGPFDSDAKATAYMESLKEKYSMSGFVINFADINY